jgi:hypothetical protein
MYLLWSYIFWEIFFLMTLPHNFIVVVHSLVKIDNLDSHLELSTFSLMGIIFSELGNLLLQKVVLWLAQDSFNGWDGYQSLHM